MLEYVNLLAKVIQQGDKRLSRNGRTLSLFGEHLSIDLKQGFPLLTTKKVHFKSVLHELIWFLSGDTNIAYLKKHNVSIWDEWADENGDLGAIYGRQWRAWNGIHDQIQEVINFIKSQPVSRRMVVNSWNVGHLHEMALPPCHCLFQFYVSKDSLSCHVYQRSADIFLGVPFNIASYALLVNLIAKITGLGVGKLHFSYGDLHLYEDHIKQAKLQLFRPTLNRPQLVLSNRIHRVEDLSEDKIAIMDYNPHPAIKANVKP